MQFKRNFIKTDRKIAFVFCLLLLFGLADVQAQFSKQTLLRIDDDEILNTRFPVMPYGLLQISDNVKYIFWFAMEQGQLILLEKRDLDYISLDTYDISIGKRGYDKFYEGDKKTPMGLYYFQKFKTDQELSDFYGIGAYPINYPNEYDLYRKRTGSGIWLHGLPKGIERRPLRDSDGCMVVSNEHLELLKKYIIPGKTLVINQNYFQWGSPNKMQQMREELTRATNEWKAAWNAVNTKRYLSFYSQKFNNLSKNYAAWARHKNRVNQHKKWINVSVDNINMVLYPGTDDIVQIDFDQDYSSSNYSSKGKKTQLWQKEDDGVWRIILETSS